MLSIMPLVDTLTDEIKTAMKAKDVIARDTLRMLKSELGQAEIHKGGPLDEADEIAVLLKAVKTRTESVQQYTEGGRTELAEKEQAEIAIIQRFLPKQLTEDEAKAAIQQIASNLGVSSKKQMGQLMKAVKEKYTGQIDGKLAAKIAQGLLS